MIFLLLLLRDTGLFLGFVTDIDRRGEIGRSTENFNDGGDEEEDDGDEKRPDMVNRVGEEGRVKNGDGRGEKAEDDDDANGEEEEERDVVVVVLFLEEGGAMQAEEAIVVAEEREWK